MKIIYSKLPSKKVSCVATIGAFDGIHKGHQFILRKVTREAKRLGVSSLVITFDLHPQQFFRQNPSLNSWHMLKPLRGLLTDSQQKSIYIKSTGIEYLWFLKTNRSLLELSASDFVAYVFRYFKIKKLILGNDFRFGYGAEGGVACLKKLTVPYDFKLSVFRKKQDRKNVISSSAIRTLILEGKLKEAAGLLGRYFSLKGKVCKGRSIGSRLGIPTANIAVKDYIIPARGVYAAYVVFDKNIYYSAVNVGLKPTVGKENKPVIEAHIINFKKNILGYNIEVFFIEKLRNERKFPSLAKLKEAIQKDINSLTAKYSISSKKHPQPLVF